MFAGLRFTAIYRMAANRQRLHQGQLLEAELLGTMELSRRQNHPFAHAAVAHHAECLVGFAAIREAATAGVAVAAIDVRLDRAAIAKLHVCHVQTDLQYFHAQLVAGNAWIAEERHFAEETTDIRAANADAINPQQRFVRPGLWRLRNVDAAKLFGLFELDGFHESSITCANYGRSIVFRQTFGVTNIFDG